MPEKVQELSERYRAWDVQMEKPRWEWGGGAPEDQRRKRGAAGKVEDGFIHLDDAASEAIGEWKDDPKKARITYRQLLTLTSGLLAGERGAAGHSAVMEGDCRQADDWRARPAIRIRSISPHRLLRGTPTQAGWRVV